jgi:exodeoxyribonuclease VII small subunit
MAKRTFENALTKLDRITAELEQGDLSLDKSLKKFDEGV